jgi:hypothetical protein
MCEVRDNSQRPSSALPHATLHTFKLLRRPPALRHSRSLVVRASSVVKVKDEKAAALFTPVKLGQHTLSTRMVID